MATPPEIRSSVDTIPIERRSGWADALKFFAVLYLLAGGILLLAGLANEKAELAWPLFIVCLTVAINCFFFGFMVDVFTDIRWYLRQLNLRLESLAAKAEAQPPSPASDPETVRRTQLMAEMATQLKNLDSPKP